MYLCSSQIFSVLKLTRALGRHSPYSGQPFILHVAVIGKISASGTLSEVRIFFDSLFLQSIVSK